MQSAKQKMSNIASAAKEHITICTAKAEEQVEKASAVTAEEREIAKERRKAKEAKAKMELHEAKARHAAQKLNSRTNRYGTTAAVHNPVVAGHHPPHHGIHDPALTGGMVLPATTAAVTGAPAPVPAYPPTVPMGTQYPAGTGTGHHYI